MKNRDVFVVSHTQDLKSDAMHIEEALDIAGYGRYNYVVTLACSIIHLGSVIDMLGFSLVAPSATCDLQLSLEESALLTSIPFAGFMFSLLWGYFADSQGRRKAILITSSVGFIVAVINSFSTNFIMMLILKFIGSGFSNACLTLTTTYLGECVPKKHRSKAILIQNCFDMASDLVTYGLAYIFLPMTFNLPLWSTFTFKPWRLLSLALTIPMALGALIMLFLHESPKFLADKGEVDKALEVLKSTYKINGGKEDSFPVTALIGNDNKDENVSFWKLIASQTILIFKPPLLWRSILLFYLLAICCATNNVFYLWFPTMVNSFYNNAGDGNKKAFCQRIITNMTTTINENELCDDHTPINTIYAGILFSIFFVILNLAVLKISSKRKLLLVSTFVISGIGAALLNLFENDIVNVVLFTLIQFTGISHGTIDSYFVEVYPTAYRGLAASLGMTVTRFICLGGVNLVGAMIIDYCQLIFYSWAILIFSGVVAALLLPSDRKLTIRQ